MSKHKIIGEHNSRDSRFYGDWRLEEHEVPGQEQPFWIRPDTSDVKALQEVLVRRAYGRHDFTPRPGEQWFDIGAYIGAFTVWAAMHGADVTAFEPDPVSMRIAKLNAKRINMRGDVHFHSCAVLGSAPEEELKLTVNAARGNFWRNSLYHKWRGGFDIPVESLVLDEIIDPGTNLKIDAEGAEMGIIEESDIGLWGRVVFEWSFDIDRSIPRFKRAIKKLRGYYDNVRYGKFDEKEKEWQGSWFPPTRLVYCW